MIKINSEQLLISFHCNNFYSIYLILASTDIITHSHSNIYSNQVEVSSTAFPISIFQVAQLSPYIFIFAFVHNNINYAFILFSIKNNNYIFSDPISMVDRLEHNQFVVLSDFTIYIVRSGEVTAGEYNYIGNIVSFSIGNEESQNINEDFFFSFYYSTNKIELCNSSCRTCISSTECLSCHSQFKLYSGICKPVCTGGYLTMKDGSCFLIPADKSTEPKETFLNVVEDNLYVSNSSYIIKGKNYTIEVISSSINKKTESKNAISSIDFDDCEKIIRSENGYSDTEEVFIVKVDEYNESSIIPTVTYKIYDSNKNVINTSNCNSLSISYPLLNTLGIKYEKAKNMSEQYGIDLFNINDDFFQDKCYPYKEKGNDIILRDRVDDFYENISLCDKGCIYQSINYTTNRVICLCSVKNTNNANTTMNSTSNFFQDLYDLTNIDLFKCGRVLFNFDNIKKNIGVYFGFAIILIEIGLIVYLLLDKEIDILYLSIFSSKNDIVFIQKTHKEYKESTSRVKFDILRESETDMESDVDIDNCKFKEAVHTENRTFLNFFFFPFLGKLELISIIFFKEQYQLISISLSNYFFSFYFEFAMNALLFSDDVISKKYHNQGTISMWTTLSLTVLSNIFSYIVAAIIKRLINYSSVLELLMDNMKAKHCFYRKGKMILKLIEIKLIIFYVLIEIIVLLCFYYIAVFCAVYSGSQWSWFSNSLISIGISLLTSLGLCLLISFFRYLGLKMNSENIYNVSLYLNK